MGAKRSQNPDPFKTERVGHPEKLNQSLGVDVLEWYHPNVIRRQEEKSQKDAPPAFDFKKMDDRNAIDPKTTQGEEQHTVDHEIAGHAVDFDNNPVAEQNKDYGHAEFDADKAADTVEAEKNSLGNKDAEKDVREIVKEPKPTKRSEQD